MKPPPISRNFNAGGNTVRITPRWLILAPAALVLIYGLFTAFYTVPPGPVKRSFDEVNRAQQEREQMINEANGEYNRVIPKARGTAEQRISAAEGYAIQRVNRAEGEVTRFREMLAEYEKSPAITRRRIYLETMNDVLPKLGSKVILDEDARQFLPLMNLQGKATP